MSLTFIAPTLQAQGLKDTMLLTEEYPPYNYTDKENRLQGSAVELLLKAYQYLKIPLSKDAIKVQPWARSYRQALKGNNVILFSMTRTPSREALFKWVGPIGDTKVVLMAKKSRQIQIENDQNLADFIIGGIHNDVGIQLISEKIDYRANILTTPHADSLAKMLNLNRIDLWAYEENAARHFFLRNNLNPDDFQAVYTLSESQLYYAFSLNTAQETVDQLQQAIDQVRKLE